MIRSTFPAILLVIAVLSVTIHSSVATNPFLPVVPTPDCSYRTLTAAAKCKCSLLQKFLPFKDYRLQVCRSVFGHNLSSLGKKCDRFSSGATSNYDLAAMFAIEKLGGKCFPKRSCVKYGSKMSVQSETSQNAESEFGSEYSLQSVTRPISISIKIVITF